MNQAFYGTEINYVNYNHYYSIADTKGKTNGPPR